MTSTNQARKYFSKMSYDALGAGKWMKPRKVRTKIPGVKIVSRSLAAASIPR